MVTSSKALVSRVSTGQSPRLVQEQLPLPIPDVGQVLVKVSHVAQNPTDILSFDRNAYGDGAVLGCDFVGEVTELGAGVTRLLKGDLIAGLIRGGETPGVGGFSEYTLADQHISFKIPKNISRVQASTIPLAAGTAWLALFSHRCLALNRSAASGTSVLVWGGSSSVGLYAIQLASICGFSVITTCSPRNFDLVRSCGANHIFDYNDPTVIDKIKEVSADLRYAFDTIGSITSSTLASRAWGDRPGNLCTVRPGKANTEQVTSNTRITDVLLWTVFLKDQWWHDNQNNQFHWPASKEDNDLAKEFFDKLPSWLEQGQFQPNKTRVLSGLDSVPHGFQEYRDGKISAYKIVYEL
ncbi:hypothetical protein N7462_005846 [Penicillium macrosclerotiorum]|uniref:uncharacterized protein n=1 Tax=Penicillium macrosclerotiorum TaxID=303699 RepID=UPI0025494186|nr:uncharacterized protein N7462_005846 [Penicillium macrosclerotiorum]KAJ5682681.1 hypothetical protein N7462_005846 [Penicillium macrosclerotiorum]